MCLKLLTSFVFPQSIIVGNTTSCSEHIIKKNSARYCQNYDFLNRWLDYRSLTLEQQEENTARKLMCLTPLVAGVFG